MLSWRSLTLKFDHFISIFDLSLDKSLYVSDIQLWQCSPPSIMAGKSESGALNWSIRKIWMLSYGQLFRSGVTRTIPWQTDWISTESFLKPALPGQLRHTQSCGTKGCLEKGSEVVSEKVLLCFYNKSRIFGTGRNILESQQLVTTVKLGRQNLWGPGSGQSSWLAKAGLTGVRLIHGENNRG